MVAVMWGDPYPYMRMHGGSMPASGKNESLLPIHQATAASLLPFSPPSSDLSFPPRRMPTRHGGGNGRS